MELSARLALIKKAGLSDRDHVVMTVAELRDGVAQAYAKGRASAGNRILSGPVRDSR